MVDLQPVFSKFDNQKKNTGQISDSFVCYKLWQLLIIRHNGDVVPCGMPFRSYDESEYLLGNLHKNTIKECWHSPKLNKIRQLQKDKQYHKIPFCNDCMQAYTDIEDYGLIHGNN